MTESSEGESERKARLDRSRDRGAYAVEEEISKRISFPSLSRIKLRPDIWRRVGQIWHRSSAIHTLSAFPDNSDLFILSFTRLSTVILFF